MQGAKKDYSSKKISLPPLPHGKRRPAGLFLCTGKACCKFCSAQPALATRKTVRARNHVRVRCRHGRQHQTLHQERAQSHQPCAQRQAWVVQDRDRCRTKDRGSQRPMARRFRASYHVPRLVGPAQALAIHQARSRCPCRCAAPPSYPYTRPARCPPLSPDNMLRSGSGARLRDKRVRRRRV